MKKVLPPSDESASASAKAEIRELLQRGFSGFLTVVKTREGKEYRYIELRKRREKSKRFRFSEEL